MTTLTATAVPNLAAVLLQVAGAAAGPVILTRTDDNGTHPVRLLPDQEPISGTLIVYDYEPALTGTLTYTLTDTASDTATDTATLTGTSVVVLSTPHRPARRHSPLLVTDLREDTDTGSTVHHVIDRDDPIAVLRPGKTPTGTLTLLEADYTAAAVARALLTAGDVVQLRQPTHTGLDRYLIPGRTTLEPSPEDTTPRRWTLTLEYTTVTSPDGALAGASGWDFAALTASAPTFTAATTGYLTFAALTVGP